MVSLRLAVVPFLLVGCTDPGAVGSTDAGTVSLDGAVVVDATPDALQLACTIEELTPLVTCAAEQCAMDLTTECVTTSCGLLLLGVSSECRECILTGVVSGDLAATGAACGAGDLGGL